MNYKNLELLILATVLAVFTVWLLVPVLGYLLRKKKNLHGYLLSPVFHPCCGDGSGG